MCIATSVKFGSSVLILNVLIVVNSYCMKFLEMV